MSNSPKYSVLWIDDDIEKKKDLKFLEGYQEIAGGHNIFLEPYSNWRDAEKELRQRFNQFSAIILDANCGVDPGDIEDSTFISFVLPSLTAVFEERKQIIPWFILSAGTMDNFEFVIKSAQRLHQKYEEWGQMLYIKDAPDDDPKNPEKLFEKIENLAKDQSSGAVLSRHSDLLEYMGEGKLIDKRARTLLLKMLSALYYPAENLHYEYAGNPLRKVIEFLFRAARKVGLLPDECFDGDEIKLQLASLFLAGKSISYDREDKSKQIRWGKPGDAIFPNDISEILKYVLNSYVNPESHTSEEESYLIDAQKKELFFGCVFQICHVIKWFGAFVDAHPDKDENLKMHQRIIQPTKQSKKKKDKTEIKTEETQDKVEPSNSEKEPEQVKPTVKDIIGKSNYVLNEGAGLCIIIDSVKCKLPEECKSSAAIGKKAKIENAILNEDKDADKYPFIITKLVIEEDDNAQQ